MIFKLVLDREDVNFYSKKIDLSCLYLDKLTYNIYSHLRYATVEYEVSGRGWSTSECVDISSALALNEKDDIEICRYKCRGLELDHERANEVQNWVIGKSILSLEVQ